LSLGLEKQEIPPIGKGVLRRASSLFAPRALPGVIAAIFIAAAGARAAVEMLPERATAAVFGGGRREIAFRLRNSATTPATFDLRHRAFQTSATLLAPLGDIQPCKSLTVGAGQTTLESFTVELPAVRSETLFQIAWFDGDRKIGATAVRAFPDNLFQHLNSMVDVANAALIADLSVSPRAQQSLVRLTEIAAGRRKLELPADSSP
jgi:hypothetical protein